MAVDHYGVPFSGIEPGEVDQEQHDAVRDVFYVSDAVMLVRADLFHELGGFDPATFPGSDDLDLCWRARLAGARVLVAPDARVRHRRATVQDDRPTRAQRPRRPAGVHAEPRPRAHEVVLDRSRCSGCCRSRSCLNVAEAVALVFTRRPGRARALLAGWFAAFAPGSDIRKARASTQRMRRVDDGDVRDLMVRGSARVRTFVTHRLHAGDRLAEVSNRTRVAVSEAGTRLRALPRRRRDRAGGARRVRLALARLRSRRRRSAACSDWPGAGPLWSTFIVAVALRHDGRRHAGRAGVRADGAVELGCSSATATSARTLVVAGALPLGAFGAYRLARPLARSPLPGVATSVAYAINPIARNAIAEGRARTARVLRARAVRDARAHARRRREPIDGTRVHAIVDRRSVAARRRRGVAARVAARAVHRARASRWRCRSSVVAARRVRMAIVAAARHGRRRGALAAVAADARRRRRGDVRVPASRARSISPTSSRSTRERPRAGIAPVGLLVAAIAAARRRDRLAARVGRTRVDARARCRSRAHGCRAGSTRIGVGPAPRKACSCRPRSASRSRSGSASPRSSRSCARSTSAGASSRRSRPRSVSRCRSSASRPTRLAGVGACRTTTGRRGSPGWTRSGRTATSRCCGSAIRRSCRPSAKVVDGVGFGLTREGPGDARSLWAPPEAGRRHGARRRDRTRAGAAHGAARPPLAPDGRALHRVPRPAPRPTRARADAAIPALDRVAAGAARPHGVARRARRDRLRERGVDARAARRCRPGTDVPVDSEDPLVATTAHRAPRHAARHRSDLGLGPDRSGHAAVGGSRELRMAGDRRRRRAHRGATRSAGRTRFELTDTGPVDLSFSGGPRRLLVYVELLLWIGAAVRLVAQPAAHVRGGRPMTRTAVPPPADRRRPRRRRDRRDRHRQREPGPGAVGRRGRPGRRAPARRHAIECVVLPRAPGVGAARRADVDDLERRHATRPTPS